MDTRDAITQLSEAIAAVAKYCDKETATELNRRLQVVLDCVKHRGLIDPHKKEGVMEFVNDDAVLCFYVVIAEDDCRLVRYEQGDALRESERLARKDGKQYYVARAKYLIRPAGIECVQIDPNSLTQKG